MNKSTSTTAYCYPHSGNALRLSSRHRTASEGGDYSEWSEWADGLQSINWVTASPSDKIDLEFRIDVDEAAVNDGLLPESETLPEVARVCLIMEGRSTAAARVRTSIGAEVLSHEPLTYGAQWSATRSAIAADLAFQASLVRSIPGEDHGFAMYPGEEIASSDGAVSLVVLKAEESTGGDVDVQWVVFANSEDLDLKESDGMPWKLVIKPGSTTPRLFLDAGIEGFQQVIEDQEKTTGHLADRRDALALAIVGSTWTALAASALKAASSGDIEDLASAFEEDDWRSKVIAEAASLIYPDQEGDEGMNTLIALFRDDSPQALEKISNASHARLPARRHVSRIAGAVTK